MKRRLSMLICVAATGAIFLSLKIGAPRAVASPAAGRPNIIILETDDQAASDMIAMPQTQALIGDAGATFTNSFVSFSLCSPSRSTLLTGQYAHNHGVTVDAPPTGGYQALGSTNTLPVWLQQAGYRTMFVGKYLNGYGEDADLSVPPGWDEWHASVAPGISSYFGYYTDDDGQKHVHNYAASDYKTDVEASEAASLIRQEASDTKPFFLWLAFTAPHSGGPGGPLSPQRESDDPPDIPTPVVAPKYRDYFTALSLPRPPSFNEADVSLKPEEIRTSPLLSPDLIAQIQEDYQQRLESLLSVDDGVAEIINTLAETNQLDNTYIIFTSDNGFLNGEYRVPYGKVFPYEPSIRVPLLIRGPGIPAGLRLRQLVANVDLAPTVVAASGAVPGRRMDGISLLPLFANPRLTFGRSILLERGPDPDGTTMHQYAGVRTPWYMYAKYGDGEQELYDLRRDPYELQNLASDPSYGGIARELAARLATLQVCAGSSCRVGPQIDLRLVVRRGDPCRLESLTAEPDGPDAGQAVQMFLSSARRRIVAKRNPPLAVTVSRPSLHGSHSVRALFVMNDGREVIRNAEIRSCG